MLYIINIMNSLKQKFVRAVIFLCIAGAAHAVSYTKDDLLTAVKTNSSDDVRKILMKNSHLATLRYDAEDNSILMIAVKNDCSLKTIDMILKAGCDPAWKNYSGQTALMLACEKPKNKAAVEKILNFDALSKSAKAKRILQTDKNGKTAFDYAAGNPDSYAVISKFASDPATVAAAEPEPSEKKPAKTEKRKKQKSKKEQSAEPEQTKQPEQIELTELEPAKQIEQTAKPEKAEKNEVAAQPEKTAELEKIEPDRITDTPAELSKTENSGQHTEVLIPEPELIPGNTVTETASATAAPETSGTKPDTAEPAEQTEAPSAPVSSEPEPVYTAPGPDVPECATETELARDAAHPEPKPEQTQKETAAAPKTPEKNSGKTVQINPDIYIPKIDRYDRNAPEYLFDEFDFDTLSAAESENAPVAPVKNPDARDSVGRTRLMNAIMANDISQCRTLLASGADVHAADKDGWTPLMYACKYAKKTNIVNLLFTYNADITKVSSFNLSALQIAAAFCQSKDVLAAVLSKAQEKKVPLSDSFITAIKEERPAEIISQYLPFIPNVNVLHNGKTPLMYAAEYYESTDVIKLLLENGADPYIISPEKKNAFGYAKENTKIVRDSVYWSLNVSSSKKR